MQWFLILLVASVALAVLKVALAGLLIILAIWLLWGVYNRPAQTFGFLIYILVASLLMKHTTAVLVFLTVILFIALLSTMGQEGKHLSQRRLTPGQRKALTMPDQTELTA